MKQTITMKRAVLGIIFFLIPGSVFAYGEKTLILGGSAGWDAAENREGIAEIGAIRPNPVLVLSSVRDDDARLDMALSFDEGRPGLFADRTGHYRVAVSAAVASADMRRARTGTGAAHFFGSTVTTLRAGLQDPDPLVITPHSREAILAPASGVRDFTLEFWLYPMNMENGEQILTWTSTRTTGPKEHVYQRIQCVAVRNKLEWAFRDFFSAPGENHLPDFSLKGASPVAPRTWSHHLIRFDSATGLLEYLVDGIPEDILYTTSTGHEGGEVYTPGIGEEGRMVLGGRFAGLMDEFRLYSAFIDRPLLRKYFGRRGRMETRILDLAEENSRIVRVDAFGGRTSNAGRIREPVIPETSGRGGAAILAALANEYGDGSFDFADDSAVRFFIRTGDTPYLMSGAAWRPFEPGTELDGGFTGDRFRGRFVQLAAEFYPSGDGETTPYLEELRVVYVAGEPPHPPSMVTAVARNGAVDLSWRPSP
ncbi:MAG: LamG domain-containing protein, partial [Treponema sp.]|nr:LamG domain-containing protein [Treponema sp.]